MDLTLTAAARQAIARDLPPGTFLRIAFAGGCGALGFRLAATRRRLPDDLLMTVDGAPLLLDRQAARDLDGARLDFEPEEGFVLDHPRWGTSC